MTHLTNEDGEQIIIPNKHLIGEVLVNSRENSRRRGRGRGVLRRRSGAWNRGGHGGACCRSRRRRRTRRAGRHPGVRRIRYLFWRVSAVPTTAFFEVQYRVNLRSGRIQAMRQGSPELPARRSGTCASLARRQMPVEGDRFRSGTRCDRRHATGDGSGRAARCNERRLRAPGRPRRVRGRSTRDLNAILRCASPAPERRWPQRFRSGRQEFKLCARASRSLARAARAGGIR